MSVPFSSLRRYYPASILAGYTSSSVSAAGQTVLDVENELRQKASPTVRKTQPRLLADVWNIRVDTPDWDGEGAAAITAGTAAAAIQLICALPEGFPPPAITPEPSGEISFEWYRDSRHVAVVTVQDDTIRWSAITGTDAPVHGREPFARTVPGAALLAIEEVTA